MVVISAKHLPSLTHLIVIVIFGPIAGFIIRRHYNILNNRATGSWFWYASWIIFFFCTITSVLWVL